MDSHHPRSRAALARSGRQHVLCALLWIGAGLAVAGAGIYGVMRQSVPGLSGVLILADVKRPVDIVLGPDAVPHIQAHTSDDAYVALGFLHAQNRLWQMELMRRAGQGRLSEIFGRATLESDVFIRTLDLYGHAERSLAALSDHGRRSLDAYARGVNAFLVRPTSLIEPRYPPEFLLTWHTPEPWKPADSIVIVKMMALQLSRNLDKEIQRLRFAALGLKPDEIEHLMPTEGPWGAPPLPDLTTLYPVRPMAAANGTQRASLIETLTGGGASNNWVLSGARTVSGKPLLANDPHLRLSAPTVWYLAHLAIGEAGAASNLVGATLPGTPLIPLGRGDQFAWGLTNTESDVQDLFIERVNPTNAEEYQTLEGWRAFTREAVTVRVRGGGDMRFERRSTRHGPVISGVYQGLGELLAEGTVAALQWTGLAGDDTTIEAGLFDTSVTTVAQAQERARKTVGPMQSMVVADTTGAIGMIAAARVPVRDPANTVAGRAPVPGWSAVYDWKATVPMSAMPLIDNPPDGVIATSNTRIGPVGYPHHLTFDWGPAFRQQRIEHLLAQKPKHDMDSLRAIQMDVQSLALERLNRLMGTMTRQGAGGFDASALALLDAWDGGMRAESAAPLIFVAWVKHAIEAIYDDDTDIATRLPLEDRVIALLELLDGRAKGRDWCDDRRTTARETCSLILGRTLDTALRDLERRYGPVRSRWTWGQAHYADGEHQPFGLLPVGAEFFNIRAPSPGGSFTINRGAMHIRSEPPYASRDGTTFRGVYDLADLEASLYITATGQSGNPFSPFYRSFVARWVNGDYIRIPTDPVAIARERIGVWRLAPAHPTP